MPFDRAELHFAEAALYQEYEPEGENKILPFNPIALQIEEEDDGKVVELEKPPKIRKEELVEVDLNDREESKKPVKISKGLSEEEREKLVALLREYNDVFAWSYQEMLDLSPNMVTHKLKVDPNVKPVKQPPRKYRLDVVEKIKLEVQKLLKARFIEEIECLSWLANIVPVKKKKGQIRICVDFWDLNKACTNDEFPLSNVDILVDAAAGHERFSFMDGCSGYNQIFMDPIDASKTAFRTPFGNYFYMVMPFGLKNAGATYQRTMTLNFRDMLDKQVEDYVDDLVVKAKNPFEHLVIKRNPVKYLLTRPQLSGRMAQWAILASCLDIECIRPTAIKGQEVMVTEEQEWSMHLDGSSTFQGGGIGVVLKSPREEYMFAYKLHFLCSNNEAKYEAFMVGLKVASRLEVKRLKVFGDSELVIRQVEGIHRVKNPSSAAYRVAVQRNMEHFTFIKYKVVNKNENKLVDSLATLATKSY
ncbi:uncharacterized protein LOC142644050 [Castanea sativa]|uniref:uncharacterized protein LOC142644050 n=1 Tax=Castanea sativa TaxID=21020 RepID=UPI003F64F79F